MPEPLSGMCAIRANDNEVFLVGGLTYEGLSTNATWIFNLTSQKWRRGPEMADARAMFSCTRFYSGWHFKHVVVVSGGVQVDCNDEKNKTCARALDTVEIIDAQYLTSWEQGWWHT